MKSFCSCEDFRYCWENCWSRPTRHGRANIKSWRWLIRQAWVPSAASIKKSCVPVRAFTKRKFQPLFTRGKANLSRLSLLRRRSSLETHSFIYRFKNDLNIKTLPFSPLYYIILIFETIRFTRKRLSIGSALSFVYKVFNIWILNSQKLHPNFSLR